MSLEAERSIGPVRATLAVTLVLNLAVAGAKLAVGSLVRSISMVADGFHSLVDAASNVVGLIGISWAARPPDEDHPYGHWKFETLAALIIGGLLTFTAVEILESCFERLRDGSGPRVTAAAFAVMIGTMVINLAVSAYERRRGRELSSDILLADAAHTRSDFFASLAVLISLAASRWGYPQVDLLAALAITGVIGRAAIQILRRSALRLTDTAVVAPELVRRLALEVPGVESVHRIRSRRTPGGGHADLHIQVRPDLPLDRAHVIGHAVADRLREALDLADVVTHVEPPVGHQIDWQPGDEEPDEERLAE